MGKLVISLFLFLAATGPALAQAAATKPPTPAPSTSAPSPSTSAPSPSTSAPSRSTNAPSSSTSAPSNRFSTEAAAKAHCPGDTVVWATLTKSKAYHLSGDRYYGKTRHGAYMCRKDAESAGMHQTGRRVTTSSTSSRPPSGSSTGTSTSGSTNR